MSNILENEFRKILEDKSNIRENIEQQLRSTSEYIKDGDYRKAYRVTKSYLELEVPNLIDSEGVFGESSNLFSILYRGRTVPSYPMQTVWRRNKHVKIPTIEEYV